MKTAEVEDPRINDDSSYDIVQRNVNTYRLTVELFSLCFLSRYTEIWVKCIPGEAFQMFRRTST